MITNDVSTCPKCGGDLKYYDRVTGTSTVVTRACTMAVTITRARATVRSASTTTERRTRTTTSAVASRNARQRRRDCSPEEVGVQG